MVFLKARLHYTTAVCRDCHSYIVVGCILLDCYSLKCLPMFCIQHSDFRILCYINLINEVPCWPLTVFHCFLVALVPQYSLECLEIHSNVLCCFSMLIYNT